MKIITVPDLHGKNIWNKIKISEFDRIVFLGDYLDSKGIISSGDELKNFEEIIKLKEENPQKVVLLLGNHDIQYLYFPKYLSSNINYSYQAIFTSLMQEKKDLFNVAFQVENHLWTHAGVSKSWLRHYYSIVKLYLRKDPLNDLGDALNSMQQDHMDILATISYHRGGMDPYGGVFWADKGETTQDFLQGVHQYVGHTKVEEPDFYGDRNGSIYFLDCLNFKEDFFVLNTENLS